MKRIRYEQIFLSAWLVSASALVSAAGVTDGVAGTTSPIVMTDYAMQDYADPASARDPFTTTDKMFRASGQQGANAANQGFVPYMSAEPLPRMRVRGFVHNGPGESMALLQIEGDDTVHLVRKGDEIGIQARAGQLSSVLKIINVDLKKVEVQSGSLKQVIIVQ